MSLSQDLEEDTEALKRVSYLLTNHSKLGVRGGLFMDQAKPLLYWDWIPIADVQVKLRSMSQEIDRLKRLCQEHGIDPQEDR